MREEARLVEVIQGGAQSETQEPTGFSPDGFPENNGNVVPLQAPVAASLNLGPEPGNVEANLLLAEEAVSQAKREHPALRWVVLPELFTCGYTGLSSVHRHAEDAVRGRSARRFVELARELEVYIAYGFPELLPGNGVAGGIADSANLVGPEGVLTTYRKRHLVQDAGEDLVFISGLELPVVEAGGLRVALAICFDLGFPEVVREMAHNGAELVLVPAGWREPYGMQYELSCAARALDNAIHLASANQLGRYPEASFETPGRVFGPDGRRISGETGVISASEIDAGAPALWRGRYGCTLGLPAPAPLEACS